MSSETPPPAACAPAPPRVRWLYPVALAVMIVVASGRSQVAGPPGVNMDKVVHFSVFGLLATLVARSPGIRSAWMAALGVSLFGISDEIRQSFTPGRSMEFADWVADTSGATFAVWVYGFWAWYRRLLETPLRPRGRRSAPPAASPASTPPNLSVPAA